MAKGEEVEILLLLLLYACCNLIDFGWPRASWIMYSKRNPRSITHQGLGRSWSGFIWFWLVFEVCRLLMNFSVVAQATKITKAGIVVAEWGQGLAETSHGRCGFPYISGNKTWKYRRRDPEINLKRCRGFGVNWSERFTLINMYIYIYIYIY